MIKDKGDKVGGNRNNIKEETPDSDAGHVSRAGAPGNGGASGGSGGLKEADEAPRVKLERGDDAGEPPSADIKTEMDGLIDSEGDPTKSPSCDAVGPGSLKSERLSSDSNDILDPQTGLRGPAAPLQDNCQRGNGTGNVGDSMSCRAPDGVQPLPSNVISKQPSNMEVQYSQQQSQIFVFTTLLANKGAEAVLQGHYPSIIAYHCAQPGTKKYLEKHPLKMGQFNKQNPAQWLNNLAMVKNRGAIRGSGGPNMPPNMMTGPNCGPNHSQMGSMMGGGPMGNMHIGPGMNQMGPAMGQMGPNMSQMGNRMAGPGQGNQMMMMKGNVNQMGGMSHGGMGPGMSPMEGFPGNNGPCGIEGLGEGDLSWDTKNPMHPNGIGNIGNGNPGSGGSHLNAGPDGISQGGPSSGGSGQDCGNNRGGSSPADLLKPSSLQGVGAYHGAPLIRFLTHPSLLNAHHSSDTRVKIPDENLTPQQRAHREEQLATIRKMQQMLFPESGMGPGGPNQGQMMDPNQNPNEQSPIGNSPNMPPNSNSGGPGINPNNVPMGFNPNQMVSMGSNCPMGSGNMGPMGSSGPMGPNGPSCSMGPNGPIGGNGPMNHNSPMGSMGGVQMGPNGPMGPNMGPNGPMVAMGANGPMGPGGMMGPNGPMGSGMNMGSMGPCMKNNMRNPACGGPDMKQSMCGDVHMNRPCTGPMGRMNPIGGMKPCMMGGPRMMPGTNMNAMNGGIMMDGGVMVDCGGGGPGDHHMGLGGPMCDDFSRNRNMGGGNNSGDKLGLRSPRSPSGADLDWSKIPHQFLEHEHKSILDGELGGQVKSPCSERGGMSSGGCLPPPPYGASPLHRSASVPIATQSPSQCSNIQMPMSAEASRASSALNSPAECGASRGSSGPGQGGTGSVKGLPKNPLEGGPEEGMFVRTLQCLAAQQQKQQCGPLKEANLMPVPSPQQIQYLNAFEGQELTIQKQPNTSLKDGTPTNQKSPGMMPGTPEGHSSSSGNNGAPILDRTGRYSLDHSPGFPGSNNPQTPNSNVPGDKQRPSPSSNRSVQDPNSKTPVRDSMGPNTPSQALNQGPYAPNASSQSANPAMTSPSHVMMSNNSNMNSNPNSLNNNPNSLSNNPNNLGNNSNSINNPSNLNNPNNLNNNSLNNANSGNSGPNNNFSNNGKGGSSMSIPSSVNSTNVNTNSNISNVNVMSNNSGSMNMGPKMPGGLDDSPTGMSGVQASLPGSGPENGGMNRGEHAPLVPGVGGGAGFDPISSLAQMSQQLTGGPTHPHGHPHSHHHAAMMMQDMGCHMEGMGGGMGPMDNMMGPNDFPPEMNMSPKMATGPMGPMNPMGPDPSMMGPRMSGKMAPFNGANVQVKASAPNTIQYLPTRPQLPCSAGPRGPPSLDFLQRVTNPMHMDASKSSGMNMQYFPGGPCAGPMGHSGSPGLGPRMDMGDQIGPMGPMRPQGPMMGPMRGGPGGMLRMGHYPGNFNSPPKMSDPFSSGMGPNPGMMCNPSFRPTMMKGAPMRMGAPNTSQPLPASMGGPGSFKSSQNFVVPSTADPNYAQQFHNFQQQLYATGTRSQAQPGPHYPGGYMPK